jgi:hypothetical protein
LLHLKGFGAGSDKVSCSRNTRAIPTPILISNLTYNAKLRCNNGYAPWPNLLTGPFTGALARELTATVAHVLVATFLKLVIELTTHVNSTQLYLACKTTTTSTATL